MAMMGTFGIAWAFIPFYKPLTLAFSVASLTLGIGLVLFPVLYMEKQRREAVQTEEQRVFRESVRIAKEMLAAKKLHKQLPTAVAELLELSAGYWLAIQGELHGTYWARALPQHWIDLRERIVVASDSAMQELLVLLNPNFEADAKMDFNDVVENVLEAFSINVPVKHDGRIPTGFIQARDIAEKLKLAASEVEKASREIARDPAMMSEFRSSDALDNALGDLKTIRGAENELRENLRGSR